MIDVENHAMSSKENADSIIKLNSLRRSNVTNKSLDQLSDRKFTNDEIYTDEIEQFASFSMSEKSLKALKNKITSAISGLRFASESMNIFKSGLQDHMMLYFPEHDPSQFDESLEMLYAIEYHAKLLYDQSLVIGESFDKLFFRSRKDDLKTRIGIMNQSIKSFQAASKNMVKQTSKCSKNQQKNNPSALLEYINESEMLFEAQRTEIINKIRNFKSNERHIWNQRLSRVLKSFCLLHKEIFSQKELAKLDFNDTLEKPISNLDYNALQDRIEKVRRKSSLARSSFTATNRNHTLMKNRNAFQLHQSQILETSLSAKANSGFTSISENSPLENKNDQKANNGSKLLTSIMDTLDLDLDDYDTGRESNNDNNSGSHHKKALTLRRTYSKKAPNSSTTKKSDFLKTNPTSKSLNTKLDQGDDKLLDSNKENQNYELVGSKSAPIILKDLQRPEKFNSMTKISAENHEKVEVESENESDACDQEENNDENDNSSFDSFKYDMSNVVETRAQANSIIEHDSAIEIEKGSTIKYFPNSESNGWVYGQVVDSNKSGWFPKFCVELEGEKSINTDQENDDNE